MTSQAYGTMADGTKVSRYELTNAHGLKIGFLNYGGIVTEIVTPDRHGHFANIALGLPDLAAYVAYNEGFHFGGLIGRYANRLAGGHFTIDGRGYDVPLSEPPNALHGGKAGFDRHAWTVQQKHVADGAAATLSYVSPAGEEGFPGTLTVHVTYTLTDEDAFRIDYEATTDAPTVVNLTNHTYFNLGGNGSGSASVERTLVRIDADHYTPTDPKGIPAGAIAPVQGTPFDLRRLTPIGEHLRSADKQMVQVKGYDINFVLNDAGSQRERQVVLAHDPETGRTLRVISDQPGVQFYTGNGLDGTVLGSAGTVYRQGDGFALETQHYPDSPNHPSFPSTLLKPGQTYRTATTYRFSVDKYRPE